MFGADQLLRLNFAAFDKAWMLNYAYSLLRESKTLTEWKKDILYFIIDYLSASDEIKATTSGSTGTPKTVGLKKKHVKNSALKTVEFFQLQRGDNVLLALPVRYIAGKLMIVRALEARLNLYAVPPAMVPAFDQPEVAFAAFTPSQVAALKETDKGTGLLRSVRKMIVGGEAIAPQLEAWMRSHPTEIWHTYGMTETITHVALRKVNGPEASSRFVPLPGVKVLLHDDGTLIIDAPHVGVRFLKTNDMAEVFPDGSFTVLGRKDHVVISGGVKLFPEQIERKLSDVIGRPFFLTGQQDDKWGQRLVLVIEGEPEVPDETLCSLIGRYVSKFEVPKAIIYKKKLEKTASGKLLRTV